MAPTFSLSQLSLSVFFFVLHNAKIFGNFRGLVVAVAARLGLFVGLRPAHCVVSFCLMLGLPSFCGLSKILSSPLNIINNVLTPSSDN